MRQNTPCGQEYVRGNCPGTTGANKTNNAMIATVRGTINFVRVLMASKMR